MSKFGGRLLYESACKFIDSDDRVCNAPTYKAIAYARGEIDKLSGNLAEVLANEAALLELNAKKDKRIKELESEVSALKESVREDAEHIAMMVIHHIDTMYPACWNGVPKIARTSIRNTIINQVSALPPVELEKEI